MGKKLFCNTCKKDLPEHYFFKSNEHCHKCLTMLQNKSNSPVGNFTPKKGAKEYKIKDITLKCSHCKHNLFIQSRFVLETSTYNAIFSSLESAPMTYICNNCGMVHFFSTI